MNKKMDYSVFILLYFVLFFFVITSTHANQNIVDLLEDGKIKQKVSHYMIIIDSSVSMSEACSIGHFKNKLVEALLLKIHKHLPQLKDLKTTNKLGYNLNGAYRVYGNVSEPEDMFGAETELLTNGFEPYSMDKMNSTIKNHLPTSYGESPLEKALDASVNDFNKIKPNKKIIVDESGNKLPPYAIIIISDWEQMTEKPKAALINIQNRFPNDVCIYPVFIGDNDIAYDHMERFFEGINQNLLCHPKKYFVVDDFNTNKQIVDFVVEVFFNKEKFASPPEEDITKICESEEVKLQITFAFDKFEINKEDVRNYDEAIRNIEDAILFLNKCPSNYEYIEIQGHTCSLGTKEYNEDLSYKRANSVYEYFKNNGFKYPEKITVKGYGYSIPIQSNLTDSGRIENRRTVLKIGK